MVRVKDLVAGHDRYHIFHLGQVNDIVSPARDHIDCLDLIARNLKFLLFPVVDVLLLDQAVTSHHDEQLSLGVVPVLPLGDARTADVDGHLAAIRRVDQSGEGAPVVHIHLQSILKLFCGQINQVQEV